MTLVEFLLDRIDEDVQRTLSARPFDSWEAHEDDYEWDSDALTAGWHTGNCGWRQSVLNEDCGCGVPARVLAECEALRLIVAGHGPWHVCPNISNRGGQDYEGFEVDLEPCPTLRLLALPFSSHPDYDEAWKPESS